jgi:hypothetical protein
MGVWLVWDPWWSLALGGAAVGFLTDWFALKVDAFFQSNFPLLSFPPFLFLLFFSLSSLTSSFPSSLHLPSPHPPSPLFLHFSVCADNVRACGAEDDRTLQDSGVCLSARQLLSSSFISLSSSHSTVAHSALHSSSIYTARPSLI